MVALATVPSLSPDGSATGGHWPREAGMVGPLALASFAAERRERDDGTTILALSGELDLRTVSRLEDELSHDDPPVSLVIVDLSQLEFIDSSGLHALLATHRRLQRSGGRLVIVRGSPQVQRVLEITGLDRLFEIVEEPPPATPNSGNTIAPRGAT